MSWARPSTNLDKILHTDWPSNKDLARGGLAELVAMTLFVYFGCGAASSNAHFQASGEWDPASVLAISLTFGLAITVLAYTTAHTSGGHINCAVTFALTIVGECHPVRAVVYLAAQLLGSIFGALLLNATTTNDSSTLDRTGGLGANGYQNDSVTGANAFVVELMGTFLLVYVVLETAVNNKACTTEKPDVAKQSLAPIAIGLAVFVAHIFLVPITGCSINPTRSFGPALVAGKWDNHWVWWVAPLCGALMAAILWLLAKVVLAPSDDETSTKTSQPMTTSV